MASKFEIDQHIRVEALGTRIGTVSDPYGELIVDGKSYNPANYTITNVLPEDLTQISTTDYVAGLGYQETLYVQSAPGDTSITAYWLPVSGASGYKVYSLSSNGADQNAQYYHENLNFHTIYSGSGWTSIQLEGTVSSSSIRRSFNVPSNRRYHIVQLFANISGTYQLVDTVIANYPQPSNIVNVSATGSGSVSIIKGGEWGNDIGLYWPSYEGEDFYEIRRDGEVVVTNYVSNEDLNGPAFGNGNRNYHIENAGDPDETTTYSVYRKNGGTYTLIGSVDYAPYTGSSPSWPNVAAEIGTSRYSSSSVLLGWAGTSTDIDSDSRRYLIQISPSSGSDVKFYVEKENILNAVVPDGSYNINAYPEIPVYTVKIDGVSPDSEDYRFKIWQEELNGQLTLIETHDYGTYDDSTPQYISVTAYGWWPIECSVAECNIEASYNIDKGLLKTPEVGKCDLTMRGDEADPRVNTALQLDNKVRVKLASAASPDGTEDYLFSGFIDTLSTTYDVYGNSHTTLNAVDSMSRVLNVNIPSYEYASAESFGQRMFNIFEDYIAPATWGVSYDDSLWSTFSAYDRSVFPAESRENVSASDVINELTEGEYAVMGQNRGGVIFWFNRSVPALIYAANEDLLTEPNYVGFSTEHDATSVDHFCISDFTISNSIEDITNQVIASLSYDELTTETYEDTDSIAIYGKRSYDVQLNLDAPSGDAGLYLRRWIEEVPYFEDRSEIESLTAEVVNRMGMVTRAYQVDPLIDPVRVFIQTGPVDINGIWFAKRVSQKITPESWTITLDLTAD
jgi:hypothetical protein